MILYLYYRNKISVLINKWAITNIKCNYYIVGNYKYDTYYDLTIKSYDDSTDRPMNKAIQLLSNSPLATTMLFTALPQCTADF